MLGWASWNAFGCDRSRLTEASLHAVADVLVASGLRDAGYVYVCLDDCWMAPERDSAGRMQAAPAQFPSGIPALAQYAG